MKYTKFFVALPLFVASTQAALPSNGTTTFILQPSTISLCPLLPTPPMDGAITSTLSAVTVSSCPASLSLPRPSITRYTTVLSQPTGTGFSPITFTITETCPCIARTRSGMPPGFTTGVATIGASSQVITYPVASSAGYSSNGYLVTSTVAGADFAVLETANTASSTHVQSVSIAQTTSSPSMVKSVSQLALSQNGSFTTTKSATLSISAGSTPPAAVNGSSSSSGMAVYTGGATSHTKIRVSNELVMAGVLILGRLI